MSSALPDRPDLSFEKKQAKALLKAFKASDAAAMARMRLQLDRLKNPDSPPATLADAQFVLARERGFESWAKLKAHIESLRPLDELITPFVRAATGGQLTVAKRILSQHPELPAHRLQVACAAADVTAVEAWLARDATLASKQGAGKELPLIVACASHMHRVGPRVAAASLKCARLLLDHGADPNTQSVGTGHDHLPALFFACMANNLGLVKMLLERGAQPNDGESVYHAAEMNHTECLELLVAHGADISFAHPVYKNTALYFLADIDARPDGVQWLLEHGADPNVPSGELGATPLHRVASNGNAEQARLLIKHGADVNAIRTDGRTPFALAVRSGSTEVLESLRAANARSDAITPVDELLGACMTGDESSARAILGKTPELIGSLTPDDHRMLLHAAGRGRAAAVRLMVSLGFDIAITEPEDGWTALHSAAWRGRVEIGRLLVSLGAPVNVRDSRYGSSPIAWAAHGSTYCRKADEDYCAIVDALIDAGSSYSAAINRWDQPAEKLASPAVRAHLMARGFGPETA
jgi:ankyrin repeat protein